MKLIGKIIGYLMWIGAGILLFIFWFIFMSKWLGLLGSILAIIIAPGLIIFPIIFWIIEGVFPVSYFMIWGVGIVGIIIAGLSSGDE